MSERCEHCGCDRIYSGPPDCPRCGAPVCCEICCKEQALKDRIKALEAALEQEKKYDIEKQRDLWADNCKKAWKQRDAAIASSDLWQKENEILQSALAASCADMRSEFLGQCPAALNLQAKLDFALLLLKVAKCPDQSCDGNGTVQAGYQIHQCRWCTEREQALQQEMK